MDILVTGGAGFIGGHIAERFVTDGHDVIVLDNFDPFYATEMKRHTVEQCRERAATGDGSYRLVEGDIRDGELVADLCGDVEYIYHQAAQAGVRPSVENPDKYHSVNVDGTLNVLDAARETSIERLVLASSSSVYGKPEYLPYDEHHPTRPISPYGASKLAAERYAQSYAEVYDLPVVVLRYFTVYGPRMRPGMAISNFVSRCMNDRPPVVYGSGTQTRDFTYIDDIVGVNATLLETSVADGETMNIGSTDTIDIQTLATTIRDQIAPALEIEYADRHDADTEHTHAGTEKANSLLGYEPSTSIRAGVERFIDWYRDNREWYEPLVLSS